MEKGEGCNSSNSSLNTNGNELEWTDEEANSGEKQPSPATSSNGAASASGISQSQYQLFLSNNSQNANNIPHLHQRFRQFPNMGLGSMGRSTDDHLISNPLQGAGIGSLPPPPPHPNGHDSTAASGWHAPQEIHFQAVLGGPAGGEPSNQNVASAELQLGTWIRPANPNPLVNACYSPIYEEMGLPVDPHLRMFLVNARRDQGPSQPKP
ncbi:hypothetical protein L6164_035246 [Bauhinia variegata]|uniref:Uncharacterized protein n=1 Tax=Bauhinia variegata TaxID=167791 RepID=A0ACB9KY28_BAUVA|nr:hypothetical protein L6164_035246 [Bauhinia variegata]